MNLTEIYMQQHEERERNNPTNIFLSYLQTMFDVSSAAGIPREFMGYGVVGDGRGIPAGFIRHSEDIIERLYEEERPVIYVDSESSWPRLPSQFNAAHAQAYSMSATVSAFGLSIGSIALDELQQLQMLMEYEEDESDSYGGEVKDLFKRSWRRKDQDDAIDLFAIEDSKRRVKNIPLLDIHHTSHSSIGSSPGYAEEKERAMFL